MKAMRGVEHFFSLFCGDQGFGSRASSGPSGSDGVSGSSMIKKTLNIHCSTLLSRSYCKFVYIAVIEKPSTLLERAPTKIKKCWKKRGRSISTIFLLVSALNQLVTMVTLICQLASHDIVSENSSPPPPPHQKTAQVGW